MKTIMLFAALALVGAVMMHPAVACDHQTTASVKSTTVVACAGGKCEGQAPASRQGGTEAR